MSPCPDCPYLSDATPKRAVCCCDTTKAEHRISVEAERREFMADPMDTLLIPLPGRSAARGEVTHKLIKDMNRKERRAFRSARSR